MDDEKRDDEMSDVEATKKLVNDVCRRFDVNQSQLAEWLGCSRSKISLLSSGKVKDSLFPYEKLGLRMILKIGEKTDLVKKMTGAGDVIPKAIIELARTPVALDKVASYFGKDTAQEILNLLKNELQHF